MKDWRYIPLIEADGETQMSIDRWLLSEYKLGNQPSILRFYTWSPVAISLGYHQRHYPAFWDSLTYQGQPVKLIRRPTGGRGVLHCGDLCYSLITSEVQSSSHYEVYLYLCQFLQQGWQSLGIELSYGDQRKSYAKHSNCFSTSTSADLVDTEGVKRIGNAQLRSQNTILQQGSMLLRSDANLYQQVFLEEAPPSINLEPDAIIESLERSAASCLGRLLVKQSLQEREWEMIRCQDN